MVLFIWYFSRSPGVVWTHFVLFSSLLPEISCCCWQSRAISIGSLSGFVWIWPHLPYWDVFPLTFSWKHFSHNDSPKQISACPPMGTCLRILHSLQRHEFTQFTIYLPYNGNMREDRYSARLPAWIDHSLAFVLWLQTEKNCIIKARFIGIASDVVIL